MTGSDATSWQRVLAEAGVPAGEIVACVNATYPDPGMWRRQAPSQEVLIAVTPSTVTCYCLQRWPSQQPRELFSAPASCAGVYVRKPPLGRVLSLSFDITGPDGKHRAHHFTVDLTCRPELDHALEALEAGGTKVVRSRSYSRLVPD